MKSLENNKDIWNIIEAHNQTLKTMENLSVLESRVDSLTEKLNNFVQNVMIVRSLPPKVMNMQKKPNRLEQNISKIILIILDQNSHCVLCSWL